MQLGTYDFSDITEAVFKALQQHPYVSVLVLEPLLFLLAIHLTLYGFRRQPHWQPSWTMAFFNSSVTSLLSAINGVFLGIWGIGCGTVTAKGQDIFVAATFVFIPLGFAAYVSFLLFRKRGYYSLWKYLNGN